MESRAPAHRPVCPAPGIDQAAALDETRERTLALVDAIDDDDLGRVVDPLLSPLIWDLGHIANFEQRMLLGDGDDDFAAIYDPFEHPRAGRDELPLPTRSRCFDQMAAIRHRVVERLDEIDPWLVELTIQHEQQHNETMLQLLAQIEGYEPPAALAAGFLAPPRAPHHIELREAASRAYRPAPGRPDWIAFPQGEYRIGHAPVQGFGYDNEGGEHDRRLDAFEIAVRPVTNGEFIEWIELGGYTKADWWSLQGWHWLSDGGAGGDPAPLGWRRSADGWLQTGFGSPRPVDPSAPVCHISWFEADAYARAHGARLPSEFEWEVAASFDPRLGDSGPRRHHAWGDEPWSPGAANLDQLAFGTLPVGSADHGYGPIDMVGQVWEWTASEFAPYPRFEPFVYSGYSQPFFGCGYRVLRGGSWATRARSVSNTFRNWDHPQRRQIFSGLRLARGAQHAGSA